MKLSLPKIAVLATDGKDLLLGTGPWGFQATSREIFHRGAPPLCREAYVLHKLPLFFETIKILGGQERDRRKDQSK